jgi:hypothetical protein
MGKTDTQEKLLASWKIPVPTFGKIDAQDKLQAT